MVVPSGDKLPVSEMLVPPSLISSARFCAFTVPVSSPVPAHRPVWELGGRTTLPDNVPFAWVRKPEAKRVTGGRGCCCTSVNCQLLATACGSEELLPPQPARTNVKKNASDALTRVLTTPPKKRDQSLHSADRKLTRSSDVKLSRDGS